MSNARLTKITSVANTQAPLIHNTIGMRGAQVSNPLASPVYIGMPLANGDIPQGAGSICVPAGAAGAPGVYTFPFPPDNADWVYKCAAAGDFTLLTW